MLVVACGTADTTDDEPHDHEHSEDARTREWDGGSVPTLDAAVTDAENGARILTVDAPGFVFTGADVFDPVPGEGHAHLFVDGDLMTMIYGPEFVLPELDPGSHQLMVSLSTNDHLDYTFDGQPIAVMLPLVVEGSSDPTVDTRSDEEGTVEVSIEIHGDMIHTEENVVAVPLGSSVVIVVVSDAQDEIHVHGYDLFTHLHPDKEAVLEFVADVPGIFEIELEISKKLLIELQVS